MAAYTLPFANPQRIAGPGTRTAADVTFPQVYAQQLFFSNGGRTRYAFLVNGPAANVRPSWDPAGGVPSTKSYVHVLKSTAGGAAGTWNEVGTPHAKQIPPANGSDLFTTAGFMSATGYQVGARIYVARPVWDFVTYASSAPRPIVVSVFNMDTDEWEADLSSAADPNAPQAYITHGYYPNVTPYFVTRRASDGAILLLWRTFDFVDLSFSGADLVVEASGVSQSGADLFVSGGLVGSLSYNFVLADIGRYVHIAGGGASGFTPGNYLITAVDGGGMFTPDKPVGSLTAAGGSWVMTGANRVSSASHLFDAADVNRVIQITGGVGFNTGFFGISNDAAGVATIYRTAPPINGTPGAPASVGGSWVMTNGTRNYERVMLSQLTAGLWDSGQMVFGTVGEAIDHEPVGLIPGDGDRVLLVAQKMAPLWNGAGAAFPTESISTRVLQPGGGLTAVVNTLVTERAVVGPIQSPMARTKPGGVVEWLIPYVFVYDPSGSDTTVPCELRIMRADSADAPVWATTVIDTGVAAPPSPVNAERFDPEYDAFPVACDLATATLYLMTPAPLGQGAPFFVPYLINLFTDVPPWDGSVTIWDESSVTDDPRLGVVACANNYPGFIGMLLSDGPAGEFVWDDPFYFELAFSVPPPVGVTPVGALATSGMRGCRNLQKPNLWNKCLDAEGAAWRAIAAAGALSHLAGATRDRHSIRDRMPPEGRQLLKIGVLPLPADDGLDHRVLRYRVPVGWDGEIIVMTNLYTGPGFVDGSGDLTWRFKAGARFLPDSGSVQMERGDLRRAVALEGAYLEILSNQLVEIFVSVAPGAAGRLAPAGLVIGAIMGYTNPRRPRRSLELASLETARGQAW